MRLLAPAVLLLSFHSACLFGVSEVVDGAGGDPPCSERAEGFSPHGAIVAPGEDVVLTPNLERLDPAISVEPAAGAHVSWQRAQVAFWAEAPGTYRVRARNACFEIEAEVIVAPPLEPAEEAAIIETTADCSDLDVARGRLLCVGDGVRILEPGTGAELARTEEHVPRSYGIDSEGDRFATAAYGCGASPPCDPSQAFARCCPAGVSAQTGGYRFYELGEDGRPALRGFVAHESSEEILLSGDRAFVTAPLGIAALDIASYAEPKRRGCGIFDSYVGRPIAGDGRIHVLAQSSIESFELAALLAPDACTDPIRPAASVAVDNGIDVGEGFVIGGLLLTAGEAGVAVYDAATLERLADPIRAELEGAVVAGERLYVLSGGYLAAIDLTDPREPRLLGARPIAEGSRLATDGTVVHLVHP